MTAASASNPVLPPLRSDVPEGVDVRNVIIVGSGPAGYTAALYTSRAMLEPLMFGGYMSGGQLMITTEVENFPGFPDGITGPELMIKLREQATKFGTEVVDKNVESIDLSARPYKVTVEGEDHFANAIIIATGAEARWLGAPGEEDQKGRGISTCATCDGAFFRDQEVLVVGGGDTAMEEANFLTRFASKVTVVHRREGFRASEIMIEKAQNNPKIEWALNRTVKAWQSDDNGLTGAVLESTQGEQDLEVAVHGGFIAIGHDPQSGFLEGQVETDDEGYVKVGRHTMTSVEGVFACGDVVDTRYRQAITAAGMGCQAAIDAEHWLAAHE